MDKVARVTVRPAHRAGICVLHSSDQKPVCNSYLIGRLFWRSFSSKYFEISFDGFDWKIVFKFLISNTHAKILTHTKTHQNREPEWAFIKKPLYRNSFVSNACSFFVMGITRVITWACRLNFPSVVINSNENKDRMLMERIRITAFFIFGCHIGGHFVK